MKIIDARSGAVMPVAAFSLGEAGRGRHLEEVRIDQRVPPTGDEVGYRLFGGDETKGYLPHVVLTREDPRQRGILLRIRTSGVYTRGSYGEISLKGGDALKLTEGRWAEGSAGRVASGPDALWHVRGPALFEVTLQGGEHKGMGKRFLIITRKLKVVMVNRDKLSQMIATDDEPDVVETIRQFYDALDEDIKNAVQVAEQLEEAVVDNTSVNVVHFLHEWINIHETMKRWNIAVPAIFNEVIGGVSGVQAGTLMPGSQQLLVISVGPGGGRRYGYILLDEKGITRLASERNQKGTSEEILALVDSPDWKIVWEEIKDGQTVTWCVADSSGIHRYDLSSDGNEPHVQTTPWYGHESPSSVDPITETCVSEIADVTPTLQSSPASVAFEPAQPPISQPVALTAEEIKAQLGSGGRFKLGQPRR